MDAIPADADPAWATKTLEHLEELIKETAEAVGEYNQRLSYPDEDDPTPPGAPAHIDVIRKVLGRLLTQEGQETRSSVIKALEETWPRAAPVVAVYVAGFQADFFLDVIKTTPDPKEAARATGFLCKIYSYSDETVCIIWDEAFMKACLEDEDGIGAHAQRKKDLGQLLDGIFLVLHDRIQKSTDDKGTEAIMNIIPFLIGSFEEGGIRYLTEEGGIQSIASYLADPQTSVGVADAAATVFSFHLAGYQLSLKGADKVWDAIHAVPDFYKHIVRHSKPQGTDDEYDAGHSDLQLQCLIILRLLSLYPPSDIIPQGLNAHQAAKLEERRKAIIDAGAIPLMKSIVLSKDPKPQAIDVLSNLSESSSVNQSELWEGFDATFFRCGLYSRDGICEGKAFMEFFLKHIFVPENLKACLERGCLTPLRYHLQERDHAEATAKALLLIADYENGGKNGTDIWDPMLVTPIGMFVGQSGGAWEYPILGLKLVKSIITFPGLTDEERHERKTAFVDLGLTPIIKFMLSRPVGEYPLLANTAADVYPLLEPEGLQLELKAEEGEANTLNLSLGESVQALLIYHDKEVVTAVRLAVKLLLEDKPYKLLNDTQREEIQAALAESDAVKDMDQNKDDKEEDKEVAEDTKTVASIDESADPLRLLAHTLFVPFVQYSNLLVRLVLPLVSIFLSPGPGLEERKKAFESGAALFVPNVFSAVEEPEPTFDNDFPTFNPDPVPRDPELPSEEEEAATEEVEMEVTILTDTDSDSEIDGTGSDKGDTHETEEAVASDDEKEQVEDEDENTENNSEPDATRSEADQDEKDEETKEDEDEEDKDEDEAEEAEEQDGSNSDKSGSDSDDDSESDDSEPEDELPPSGYDFLLATRGHVINPKGDMEEWARDIMRDILTSPVPAIVKAGVMEFYGLYTRTWGGKQWNLIAKHGLVPILRDLLGLGDTSIPILSLCTQLCDSDTPEDFKNNTFYSPDLLDKLSIYLSVPSERGNYDTFQALEIIKGTYLDCGRKDELSKIREKLQTLADQPSEPEDGDSTYYPEAAKEILKELEKA